MAAKKKKPPDSVVNPDLEAAIGRMVKRLLDSAEGEFSLTDWAKVMDRGLALEKVKHALTEEEFGTAFNEE